MKDLDLSESSEEETSKTKRIPFHKRLFENSPPKATCSTIRSKLNKQMRENQFDYNQTYVMPYEKSNYIQTVLHHTIKTTPGMHNYVFFGKRLFGAQVQQYIQILETWHSVQFDHECFVLLTTHLQESEQTDLIFPPSLGTNPVNYIIVTAKTYIQLLNFFDQEFEAIYTEMKEKFTKRCNNHNDRLFFLGQNTVWYDKLLCTFSNTNSCLLSLQMHEKDSVRFVLRYVSKDEPIFVKQTGKITLNTIRAISILSKDIDYIKNYFSYKKRVVDLFSS